LESQIIKNINGSRNIIGPEQNIQIAYARGSRTFIDDERRYWQLNFGSVDY